MSALFKTGLKTGLKAGLKGAAEGAKLSVEAAAKTAAASAKTAMKSVMKNIKSISSDFIKGSEKNVKNLLGKTTQTAAEASKSLGKFVAEHPGLVVGGLAVTAIGGIALDKFLKMNDKKYDIISINAFTYGGVLGFGGSQALKIEYNSQGDKLLHNDSIVITDSNSDDNADGGYIIRKVVDTANPPYMIVNYGSDNDTSLPKIKTPATSGTLIYKTTFESQTGGLISEAAGIASDLGGDLVGGVVDQLTEAGGFLEGFAEYSTYIVYFIYIVIFFVLYSYIISPLLSIGSSGKHRRGGDNDSTEIQHKAECPLLLSKLW